MPVPPPLHTPHPLGDNAATAIAAAMNGVLADAFTLYMKTKNFHWHVSGPHFRDYHLMLDEQAGEIFAMTDAVAERVRKIGQRTLTSIGAAARLTAITENDAEFVAAPAMLAELEADNRAFAARLRAAHDIADEHDDLATESLIENWIDETERRVWFLYETTRVDPVPAAAKPRTKRS